MRKETVIYCCDYCKKLVVEEQLLRDNCDANNVIEFCSNCLTKHKQYVIDKYFKNDFNYMKEYYFEDVIKVKNTQDKYFIIKLTNNNCGNEVEGEIVNLDQMYEIAWNEYKNFHVCNVQK